MRVGNPILGTTADKDECAHPLFTDYVDTGRAAIGVDQPWAYGTCVLKHRLHDAVTTDPATFKTCVFGHACIAVDPEPLSNKRAALGRVAGADSRGGVA